MTQRPSLWTNLVSGAGQALPLAVMTALMGFGTLMVNLQIQVSELKLKQDQTLQILQRSEEQQKATMQWLKDEIEDLDDRVRRLERGR